MVIYARLTVGFGKEGPKTRDLRIPSCAIAAQCPDPLPGSTCKACAREGTGQPENLKYVHRSVFEL